MTDEDQSKMYAKRAVQRKQAREASRYLPGMNELKTLKMENRILKDRLALALHAMTHHEQFIRYETTAEWIKYLEDWEVELLSVEPRPPKGRKWKHDFLRAQQRYRFLQTSIRGMLRRQIANIMGAEIEDERREVGQSNGANAEGDGGHIRDPDGAGVDRSVVV